MYSPMIMPVIAPANRLIVGTAFMLASMIVLADQLSLTPDYEELISEDIYTEGEAWRVPPANESQWRPPREDRDSGRIKFGYDPVYERIQSNRKPLDWDSRADDSLRGVKPNNLLRIDF